MAKRILVTGAAGFIGFHTTRALLEGGNVVVGVDNLNTYYDPALKEARLELLKKHPRFFFQKRDIAEQGFSVEGKIDLICHLAAQAGVRYSIENPWAYNKSNIDGMLSMLEFARANSIQRLVYASSSSVYGESPSSPFNEEQRVDSPISLYAATKKSNELYAATYSHLFGLQTIGLRFFTVYGPYGRPDMAPFKFTKSAFERKPIEVYNQGDMRRDFTYVADIVSGVTAALEFEPKGRKAEIFNLGRGEPIALLDFIGAIEEATGLQIERKLMPMQPGDVPSTYADITKARNLLGYNPKISVKAGVKNFVDWYREFYKK